MPRSGVDVRYLNLSDSSNIPQQVKRVMEGEIVSPIVQTSNTHNCIGLRAHVLAHNKFSVCLYFVHVSSSFVRTPQHICHTIM